MIPHCRYCLFQESRVHHGQQQPLTAKQQVALWLTRTSMSDLSSVPSLRSLVFGKHPKSDQHNSPHCGSSRGSTHASRGHSAKMEKCRVRRGCSGRAEIQRNFSTKSLIVNGNKTGSDGDSGGAGDYVKARGGSDLASPAPIRKCETVNGLLPHQGHSSGGHRSLRHPSSLSLFRRLALRKGGEEERGKRGLGNGSLSGLRTPQGTRSYFSGSVCESPFRVRKFFSSSSHSKLKHGPTIHVTLNPTLYLAKPIGSWTQVEYISLSHYSSRMEE